MLDLPRQVLTADRLVIVVVCHAAEVVIHTPLSFVHHCVNFLSVVPWVLFS